MARTTPLVEDNIFKYYDVYEEEITITFDISQEPDAWQEMLETLTKFRVIHRTKQGFKLSYSAYKKRQVSKVVTKSGVKDHLHGDFWIAHKRVNKKLRRKYIGKNANVTPEKLTEVAVEICQGRIV